MSSSSGKDDGAPLWLVGYGSLLYKPPLHELPISQQFTRFPGYLNGFARKFWQSSYDNRGTPEKKGRVVTIIPAEQIVETPEFHEDIKRYELAELSPAEKTRILSDADELAEALQVWGCIYYIPPSLAKQASEYLDLREKDGYTTHDVKFNMVLTPEQQADPKIQAIVRELPKNSAGEPTITSVVYIGTVGNESFIGPELPEDTADLIRVCAGDSGPNDEYLIELNKSLQDLDPTGEQRARDPYLEDLVRLVQQEDPTDA